MVAATESFAHPDEGPTIGPKRSPLRDDESATWALAADPINVIATRHSTDFVITGTSSKFPVRLIRHHPLA